MVEIDLGDVVDHCEGDLEVILIEFKHLQYLIRLVIHNQLSNRIIKKFSRKYPVIGDIEIS